MINILKTCVFAANIIIVIAMIFVATCFDRKEADGATIFTMVLLIGTALVSGVNAGMIHYLM